jgi:hypothetical protein
MGGVGVNAVVISCSLLVPFVEAAQKARGTSWPVIPIDRSYHLEPAEMKRVIADHIGGLDPSIDTVLVSQGFCGGVWDHVTASRRTVIPRVDDCVSLLLATDDENIPNRKESCHLYIVEPDPEDFDPFIALKDKPADLDGFDDEMLFHYYFDPYGHVDIVDSGVTDCYSIDYVEAAQKCADRVNAELGYVEGSNLMLEKLVAGEWDEQFIVAQPGDLIRHGTFF